jgi:multidrug efflux pump subunit AcrA (membrane-fusion protein)
MLLLLAAPLCNAAAPAALPVFVAAPPIVEKFAPSRTFSGKFEAPNSATIRPRIGGQILKVLVKEGQAVKKGDMLFQLDDALLKAELAKGEARLQIARRS